MAKRITSIDVAQRAGVSQSTVSRVFNDDSPNVSAEKRERVLRAAQDLGYQPSAIARMMSKRQTNTVGVVMANITNPFYPHVLEKFAHALQSVGRQMLFFTAPPQQGIDDILPTVLQHRVDALVITSATVSSAAVEMCAQARTPLLLFNRFIPGARVNAVCADNLAGGRTVAHTFLERGLTRLAYIAGAPDTSTNQVRLRGFLEGCAAHGCDPQTVRVEPGDFSYEAGQEAMWRLLTSDDPPEAVFCANDIIAIGALDAARQCGVSVPDDLSVIGYDDIPMAAWDPYNLTTIRQDVDAMVQQTVDLLQQHIADPYTPPQEIFVPGALIERGTVRL